MKHVQFNGPNNALLVLGWRTGAHREDWTIKTLALDMHLETLTLEVVVRALYPC
jgi:hypothetical protein